MNLHVPSADFRCNACQGRTFTLMATRTDDVAVLRCDECGLGVIEAIPEDLGSFYDDAYYGSQKVDGAVGYNDYQLMAEHGLSWAAELVCCLKDGGKILDIGCADGNLLKRLPSTFDLYGIEVNERMIAHATESNIKILGRDLLDPAIPETHTHQFDCVTAIAVFEHLRDFRRGVQAALSLLKPDGFLLFEVPYISDTHQNRVWFESSLEHVFYPSGSSLRLLIEGLGFHLVGGEIYIRDFASNFVGIVFSDGSLTNDIKELFARITGTEGRITESKLRAARQKLMLIHAAQSTPDLLVGLPDLSQSALDVPLLTRIEQLWTSDLRRLTAARTECAAITAKYSALANESKATAEAMEAQISDLSDHLREEAANYAVLLRTSAANSDLLKERIERLSNQLNQEAANHAALARESNAHSEALQAQIEELSEQLRRETENYAALARESKAHSEVLDAQIEQVSGRLKQETESYAKLALQSEKKSKGLEARITFLTGELDQAAVAYSQLEQDTKLKLQELAIHINALSNRLAHATDSNIAITADRARLSTHVSLLEAHYADRERAAQAETISRELEVANLKESVRALTDQVSALGSEIDLILRSTIWRSTSILRRAGHRVPQLARMTRQALKLVKWTLNFELRQRLRETIANRRRLREEELAAAQIQLPRLAFDQRTGFCEPVEPTADEAAAWPSDRPLVSVVIVSFNYGHFVAEAVDSVLAQTFDNLEVIVVEGGSTEPLSREQTLALTRPKTTVVVQTEPHQVGANRNFGISKARGKYICCLDADDLLKPTYIEKAVFLLETYGYDIVSSAMQQFGSSDEKVGILGEPVLADMLEGNHVLTCAVFRRSLWEKAGGYRDTDRAVTGHVYEDWLFWTQLAALGARIHNMTNDHLFLYRRHGPSLSTQTDLHGMPVHRKLIRQALGDLVTPAALRASRLAAAADRRPENAATNFLGRASKGRAAPVILLALPFTLIGGAERLLSGIVAHLTKQGWRVTVITSIEAGREHGDSTSWFEQATAEIFHLPRFLAADRWPDFVNYLIASREIDVVWIAGSAFMYNLLPSIRAAFPKIKVADLLFNTVGHTKNNRKYAHLIDVNFVENKEVLQFLFDAGESQDRVRQISSGIDLHDYLPRPRDGSVIEYLNATPDELIVGFSGRWSEEKDPLAFIEIARKSSHLPILFVMTGAGALRTEIESAVASAGLGNRFHLIGDVEDVRPWVSSYDVLVLPSRLDGRPVVVLEALALGVPVIVSSVGGLPELVRDGVNGFLCQPRMIDEFVDRLTKLALDRDVLQRMKEAARRSAERNLDARKMLSSYEQGLKALIQSANLREQSASRAD
ncbi:glycosyltransferase involved in cell wall biosynthesis/SAM-dependent methyltransferase/archaellum component FlaC [Bradyrhizobium elkanii]|uniref:glycosyltransferase n=1 Tax=Bradyrhizobium elkanii TaxID=29448 RepID=UPI0021675B51|nr:glycosyltransferase [Bradyrhizobium elkanii]MCS3686328.1 glycosyltransferase involved in cell wall biosynthesis/SAM-dependent methyltransferase/archaellum component FlaC [Bradyrhizobium elkanii]